MFKYICIDQNDDRIAERITERIANRTEFGPIEPNSDQSDQTRTKLNLV